MLKVAKSNALKLYFNEIFDAVGRHHADIDTEVKSGAAHIDRLLKDIVTEHGSAAVLDLDSFVPLLAERLNSKNPFLRAYLLGWIQFLQNIPQQVPLLLDLLPLLIEGIFSLLTENVRDVRVRADHCLAEFLLELKVGSF